MPNLRRSHGPRTMLRHFTIPLRMYDTDVAWKAAHGAAKAQAHTGADDHGHHQQEAQNHLVAVAQAVLSSWAEAGVGCRDVGWEKSQ